MPSASYHAETETLSRSQFEVFLDSPRVYYETFVSKLMPTMQSTRATELGTICHAVLLEKKDIDSLVREYPTDCLKSNGDLNPKPAAEFREKIFPRIAVKEGVVSQVESICAAVMRHPFGDVLRSNYHFEHRLDAKVEGVDIRTSPDVHWPIDGTIFQWDFKFTECIHPVDWWRIAKNLGYFRQDAFYSLLAEEKYKMPSQFRFVVVETQYPHRIEYRWYDESSRDMVKEYVRIHLRDFAMRKSTGNWDDSWNAIGTISPWDVGANDDGEIVEFAG